MKQLIGLIVLISGFLLAQGTEAGDLVASRAKFGDPSTRLSIEEVVRRPFSPIGLTLHEDYTNAALWLRLTVRAPSQGDRVVLLIRQAYLDEVRLYEPNSGPPPTWPSRATGSQYDDETRERLGASLAFSVQVTAPETTYYLRLQTQTMAQMTVEALTPTEALGRVHQYDLLQVFFATSMFALLLWAAHSYWLHRQAVVGWFVLHQAAFILYGTAVMGYLTPLLPDAFHPYSNLIFTLPYCAVSFTTLLFCRALFRAYNPPRLLMRGMNLLLLLFPFQILAVVFGAPAWAAFSNFLLVRFSWWYLSFTTFTFRTEQKPSRRMLQIVFTTVTLLFTAVWLSYYGNTSDAQGPLFGRQLLIANGLIIGILFAALLSGHSRRMQHEAQKSQTNLALAQRTLEIERTQKAEAEVLARTDHLTGLYNRRYFFEQGELEIERAKRYAHPLSLVMFDIDHFKAVNDTWGHGTGDLVLRQVSTLIRETLRSVDLFGRTGGEEFAAILLETGAAEAAQVAERLRTAVAGAVIHTDGQVSIRVTVSIGLAELKAHQTGIGDLMNEADRALYRAKHCGRNRVVYAEPAGEVTGTGKASPDDANPRTQALL